MTAAPLAEPRHQPLPFDLRRHGGRVAVRTRARSLSYAELADRVDTLLRRLGPQRRLVLLPAGNDVESLVGYLAALAGGHPLLVTAPGAPVAALVDAYDPDVVLDPGADGTTVHERRPGSSHDLHPDLALLLSTSGSTGSPKLVRLSYDNLAANAASIAEYLGIRPTDCAATTLPVHYCYGLSVVNSHLLRGAALLLTDLSVVDRCFWDQFRAAGATTFAAVPYTFDLLDRAGFADLDLPSLRYVTQAGGRLAPDRVRHYSELGRDRGWDLVVMYGQTEATARMAYLPADLAHSQPQAVGRAIPGGSFRLRPVDGNDEPGTGELVYTGPNVMLGYAHTAADLALGRTVDELPTGDLARRTGDPADGLFEVLGRIDRQAKVFGLRIDLDRVERVLVDAGLSASVAATADRLVVAVSTAPHPGHGGHAAARRARRLVSAHCGLPSGAVQTVPVGELPTTPRGKPDHHAVAALAAGSVTGPVAQSSGPMLAAPRAPQPVSDTAGLVRLYADVLDRRGVTPDDTFVSLGGDSLSYVEMSVRLEEALGGLDPRWHVTPIRALVPAPRRRRGSVVDTSVLLRAIGIVLIVGTHANLFFLQGGAHLLLAVVGYNIARFPLAAADRIARVRAVGATALRLALPAMAWIAVVAAVTGEYDAANVGLLNWLLGPDTWTNRWQFWFLESVVWATAALALLLAVPAVDRLERRAPFWFALAVLGGALAVRYDLTGVRAIHAEWYSPATVLWLIALGWAVAHARRPAQRLLVGAVTLLTVPGFFGQPVREAVIVAGVLLLLVAPQLRLPRPVVRLAAALATVSLFVYVTHWQVYPSLEDRVPALAVVASFVVGAAYWALSSRVAGLLRRCRRRTWATVPARPQPGSAPP